MKKRKSFILIVCIVFAIIGYYIYGKFQESLYSNINFVNNIGLGKDINATAVTTDVDTSNNIENSVNTYIGIDSDVGENTDKKEEDLFKVHIAGAVENECIVSIEDGARIADVIEMAGGLTDEADIRNVNLAYKVEDGQKIYIPRKDEDITEIILDGNEVYEIGNMKSKNDGELGIVNINTASQTELETLSGIGPTTALKIIKYREENGKFQNIEDIKNVPGIGESKFEAIKENIKV